MGELYLLENQLELSQSCYQSMIDRYPTHSKTPEAFLKLGQIELKRGNIEKAKSLFRYLIEHYPHSQATTLAKKSLSEMIMSETES
jgi:TolA-binding protein